MNVEALKDVEEKNERDKTEPDRLYTFDLEADGQITRSELDAGAWKDMAQKRRLSPPEQKDCEIIQVVVLQVRGTLVRKRMRYPRPWW